MSYREHWWQIWREVEPPPLKPILMVRVELDGPFPESGVARAEIRFRRGDKSWGSKYRELRFWESGSTKLVLVLTGVRKFWIVREGGVDDNQSPWTKPNVQHWDVT